MLLLMSWTDYNFTFTHTKQLYVMAEKNRTICQKGTTILLLTRSPNAADRFSKYSHCETQQYVSNKLITKETTTSYVRHYITLWNLTVPIWLTLALVSIYSAPQFSHYKRCTSYSNFIHPSVCPPVTCRYCVKMTACSTVQFALSDSKMCLVF